MNEQIQTPNIPPVIQSEPPKSLDKKFVAMIVPVLVAVAMIVPVLVAVGINYFVIKQSRIQQENVSDKNTQDTKLINTNVDNRVLLTDSVLDNLYASSTKSLCSEKTNNVLPDASISYENIEKGISFKIPYSSLWGTLNYKITNYDENVGTSTVYDIPNTIGYGVLNFGRLVGGDGCSLVREITMKFLSQKSTNQVILDLKSRDDYSTLVQFGEPKIITLNKLQVVEYADYGYSSYPTIVIIGKKYNYQLTSGYVDFQDLEKIANTVSLVQ